MSVASSVLRNDATNPVAQGRLVESVEQAQVTAERLRALMQAVHLAIHDASDIAIFDRIGSGALSKLQTIDVLADIVDCHQTRLDDLLARISTEAASNADGVAPG